MRACPVGHISLGGVPNVEFIMREPIHFFTLPANPVFVPIVEDVFVFPEVPGRKKALTRLNNPDTVADA